MGIMDLLRRKDEYSESEVMGTKRRNAIGAGILGTALGGAAGYGIGKLGTIAIDYFLKQRDKKKSSGDSNVK
ncbi:MAG: hypothetical protein LBI26_02115 [Holosporales bacterium]|jgi:F0F1-type ATP synthase membrane subunit c/vacuolar-type H+-ATPase subunit K|nr:hypothetical protein [Holosporales bacterium]